MAASVIASLFLLKELADVQYKDIDEDLLPILESTKSEPGEKILGYT